jgi:hypothetical protein
MAARSFSSWLFSAARQLWNTKLAAGQLLRERRPVMVVTVAAVVNRQVQYLWRHVQRGQYAQF